MSAKYYSMRYCLSVCIKKFKECKIDRQEKASEVEKFIAGHISDGFSVKDDKRRFNPYFLLAHQIQYIEYQNGVAKLYDVLGDYCTLLFERLGLFYHPDTIEGDLDEAVSNVIWVDDHLEIDIPQFHTIVTFLKERFGSTYVRMAKKNCFLNVSSDLIVMKSVKPPTKTLNELLDIPNNPEQEHLNWFKFLFRTISRNNSNIKGFDSTEKLENTS